MRKMQPSKQTKRLRQFKRWGWLLGILLTFWGYITVNAWGFSQVEYKVAWYTYHTQELNFWGVLGIIMCIAGIVSFVIWLLVVSVAKTSVPCPVCGTLLTQKAEICPHCKTNLNWDGSTHSTHSKEQQAAGSARYCQACGTKAAPQERYCSACGEKLSNE